jgi:signal peptidase II
MKAFLNAPRRLGLLVAVLAFILDQGQKLLFLKGLGFAHMAPNETIEVLPFFNLVMVWNNGVSFGLFPADSEAGRLFLIGFSVAVVLALAFWLSQTRDRLTAIGIGLVIGGALGNVLDRLRFGAVADFFHLHAFGYDWYVFNVADAGIVAGVGLLLYESLIGQGQQARGTGSTPASTTGSKQGPGSKQGLGLSDPGRGHSGET